MKKITQILMLLIATTFSWQSNAQVAEDFESGLTSITNSSGNGSDFVINTVIFMDGSQSVLNAYGSSETNAIETGTLDLTAMSSPILKFWHIAATEANWDKCYLEVSTDDGATYNTLPASTYLGNFSGYATDEYFDEGSYTEWTSVDNTGWKKEVFDLTDYIASSTVKIRFKLVSDSSVQREGWYIDRIEVLDDPSCDEVSNISVANILTNSVELSWDENNTTASTSWDYVVQSVGTGMPSFTASVENTATNANVAIGSLTTATSYEVYVRSVCSSAPSDWFGPYIFDTACDAFADFTENFDGTADGDMTTCWTSTVVSADNAASVDVQGGQVAFANATDVGSELLLISPDLTDLPNDTHRIKFEASGADGAAIQVGTYDAGVFTPTGGFSLTATLDQYYFSYNASTTASKIAIKALPGADATIILDNFVWQPIPACVEPLSLTTANITAVGADITWAYNPNDTPPASQDFYIVDAGTLAPDAATVPTIDDSTATSPFTWDQGVGDHAYDVYIRSDCGAADGVTDWSGPISFRTDCPIFAAPYLEDFEDAGAFNPCWTQDDTDNLDWTVQTGATGTSGTGPSAANTGDYYVYVESSWPVSTGDTATIFSPEIDLSALTTPRLLFTYHMYGMDADGTLDVAVSSDGTNYTSLFTQAGDQGDQWNTEIIYLTGYSGVVTFKVTGTVGSGTSYYHDFAIDTFKVEETPAIAPDCAVVTAADAMVGCGTNGLSLSWDAVPLALGYRLSVGTATGGIDVVNNVDLGAATSYTTDSDANTAYFYTVTAYNDIGDATGCTEASFTTAAGICPCVSNPTSNDGNGISNVQIGTTDFPMGDVTYMDNTGTVVDLDQNVLNNLQVTFETSYTYDTNVWIDFNDDGTFDNDTELVFDGVSTNANPTTLDSSFTIWGEDHQGIHFMRIGTADTGQEIPDPCYSGSWGVTVDFRVNVLAPPTCLAPTDIVISDITKNGATFASTENNATPATAWDYYIVASGSAAPDASTTPTLNDSVSMYDAGTELTAYDVYVRADCGADDTNTSVWYGPETFTTIANCVTPDGLTVTNIDSAAGTADLGWDEANASVTDWSYEITNVTDGTSVTGTATSNPFGVTGLIADKEYSFTVITNCAGADGSSTVSSAYSWTQMNVPDCVTNPMPADATVDVPVGPVTITWDAPTGTVDSYDVYTGTDAANLTLLANVTDATIDVTISAFELTVYYQVVPKNAGGSPTGCPIWSFTTADEPGCGEVFTDMNGASENYGNNENITFVLEPDNAGDVVTVDFTSFNTEESYDGFMVYNGPDDTYPVIASDFVPLSWHPLLAGAWSGTGDFMPTHFVSSDASGALTFVFTSSSWTNEAGWEADITCGPAPTCVDPTNLAIDDLRDVSVQLMWDENNVPAGTVWDVQYGPTGFTLGTGATVSAVDTNPYLLEGLTPATAYQFYVRTACELTYQSGWAGPFEFTTDSVQTCVVPENLTVTAVRADGADLGWTNGNAAVVWNIEYGPTGFTQGSGTMVATADNPYTSLSGLDGYTEYDFYVQSVCSASDSSYWAGPVTFTTNSANDAIVDAIPFVCGDTVLGETRSLTSETIDAGYTGYNQDANSAWYVFAGDDMQVNLGLCNSNYDTKVDVYSGTPDSLVFIGGNDDSCGTQSEFTFVSETGTDYYVRVYGYASYSNGDFEMTVTCEVPCTPASANQKPDLADALTLNGPAVAYDSTCSRTSPGNPSCDLYGTIADMWYTVVVPNSGELTITTEFGATNPATDINVALYEGAVDNLVQVGTECADSFGLANDLVLTGLTPGMYYIRTWNAGAAEEGTFTIEVTGTECDAPTAVLADNITDTSADVSWTDVDMTNTWSIEYGESGFAQGTGTVLTDITNPYTLSGLMVATTYDVYISSTCSVWSDVYSFTTMPSCMAPSELGVDNVQEESVDLVWTDNDGATAWNIEWGEAGFTPGTGTVTAADMNPYTLTGLTQGTNYEFYVSAVCSSVDSSAWVGPFAFSSAAAGIADLAAVGFKFYPNPVTNSLTMTASKDITSVSIFNMLGQEVYNQKLSTLEAHIDMTKLSSGTYYVKAQVGQSVGTFKVVKK